MLSYEKKKRQIVIEPASFFTEVVPEERVTAELKKLIVYVETQGNSSFSVDEEKFAILLKYVGIYRAARADQLSKDHGKSDIPQNSFRRDEREHSSIHPNTGVGESRPKSICSNIKLSLMNLQSEGPTPLKAAQVSDERSSVIRRRGHMRTMSGISMVEPKAVLPSVVNVVFFSYGGLLFELAENLQLQNLLKLVPEQKLLPVEFRKKCLRYLLKLSKPILFEDNSDTSAVWKEFVMTQPASIEKMLESHASETKQRLVDQFKQYVIQSSFTELTSQYPIYLNSPSGNLLRSLSSIEESRASQSEQQTLKKPVGSASLVSDVMESLLIGIFTCISNDPRKKESFYSSRVEKSSQLDYNSLLDLTLKFLIDEFNKSFQRKVESVEEFISRLRNIKNWMEFETFKLTGDLKVLHNLLFPQPESSMEVQAKLLKPEPRMIETVPSKDQHLQLPAGSLNPKAESPRLSAEESHPKNPNAKITGSAQENPQPNNEAVESIKKSSKLIKTTTSIEGSNQRKQSALVLTPTPNSPEKKPNNLAVAKVPSHHLPKAVKEQVNPPKDNKRIKSFPLIAGEKLSNIPSNQDDDVYIPYFEDNWQIFRNDIKEALARWASRLAICKKEQFYKKVLALVTDENPIVIGTLLRGCFGRVREAELQSVVLNEYKAVVNEKDSSSKENCNREFHCEVLRAFIHLLENSKVRAYARSVKYLFLHEDRFALGVYECMVRKALLGPTIGAGIHLSDFEENLLILISMLEDKSKKFMRAPELRTPLSLSARDDSEVFYSLRPLLSTEEAQGLQKMIYYNGTGILYNISYRYNRQEIDKEEYLTRVRRYASMYQPH